MNISDAKDQIKDTVEAYLSKDKQSGLPIIDQAKQRPVFLIGAPGIGKTAIMIQIAHELGIGLVSYSMTHHTRQSALGLPFIVHKEFEGSEYDVSEYTMSEIIASIYDYMEQTGLRRGILFLDEINCVSETLYPSLLQFLQFKTFGRHKVPQDWIIVCAGNPPEYNKSVHEFDIVTMDRLRIMDIDPDYAAWRKYALDKGVHPAITSFLEIKPENFYSVESTPSSKRFVTARGWDDLSEMLLLYEKTEKQINKSLIEQFVRDPEIAERFALYYELFNKYRSDYQIDQILAGNADKDIFARAQAAEFDERLALLDLILDALSKSSRNAFEYESIMVGVRDILRDVKPSLEAGETLAETLGATIIKKEAELNKAMKLNTTKHDKLRIDSQILKNLKTLKREAQLAGKLEGKQAFDAIHFAYRDMVKDVDKNIKHADTEINNAFDFVIEAFGKDRELLVLLTEMSARGALSTFISHYGNKKYYENNKELMVDTHRKDLLHKIDSLDLEQVSENNSDDVSTNQDDANNNGDGSAQNVGENNNGAGITEQVDAKTGATKSSSGGASHKTNIDNVVNTANASNNAPSARNVEEKLELDKYYSDKKFEYGFASLCKMTLPNNLSGKTVLDVGCRRGRGCYKLSDRVGQNGHVIGIDWVKDYVNEASSGIARAIHDTGLAQSNMEFHFAYPEDLNMAHVKDKSCDVIFVNSVMNLFYDMEKSLKEFRRVLKDDGFLICETALANCKRDANIQKKAKELGNSIQSAPWRDDFETLLAKTGFSQVTYSEEHEVSASMGFKHSYQVETLEDSPDVSYTACVAHAR